MLGWEIVDRDGEKTMNRRPGWTPNALGDHLRTTNLSVEDIIRHCYEVGYIIDDKPQAISSETATSSAVPSLSMAARPTTTFTAQVEVASTRRRTKLARRARSSGRRADPLPGSVPSFSVDGVTPAQLSLPAGPPTQSIDANVNVVSNFNHHTVVASEGLFGMGAVSSPHSANTNSVAGLHPYTIHHDTHLGSVMATEHGAGTSQHYEVSPSVATSDNEVPPSEEHSQGQYGQEFISDHGGVNIDAGAEMAAQIQQLQEMQDQYPFDAQFNPFQNVGLHFDPMDGDVFNTFNISHFDINDYVDPRLLNF